MSELRRARANAQRLGADAGEAPAGDVVRHLLCVQAQDGSAARRALAVRGAAGPVGDDVALTWLLRGTLHLCAVEDLPWLHALTAPLAQAGSTRRLGQLGVDTEPAVAALLDALADGPLDRRATRAALTAAGVEAEGQATPHVIVAAAIRGLVVLDPGTRDVRLATPPEGPPPDRDAALRELGRRYLRAHAPAGPEDLARWSGLPLRDTRVALAEATAPEPDAAPVPPRLLGPFDEYLLGWDSREHCVDGPHARLVAPGGGIVRGVATVDGQVVGTWTKAGGIDWFRPPADEDRAALEAALPVR